VKNLPAAIFQQAVERHPAFDKPVDRIAPLAEPEQIATRLEPAIA
jgi:hypothetical protein